MPRLIQVSDRKDNGPLAFDLVDILTLLPSEVEELTWSILDLGDALGDPEEFRKLNTSVLEIDERAHNSPGGLLVTWDQLMAYAKSIRQTIDGLFAGCTDTANLLELPKRFTDGQLYDRCEIALQAFDSTYWLIYARNPRTLGAIQTHFKDVTVLIEE